MKKILSIVLSLAAATVLLIGTAFAGDTVLLEETNGEVTDAINAAPEGAMIICTVKYDPDNANNGTTGGNGWGIGGVVTDGSWTVGSDYQAVYNSEGDFSLEPGEVRAGCYRSNPDQLLQWMDFTEGYTPHSRWCRG